MQLWHMLFKGKVKSKPATSVADGDVSKWVCWHAEGKCPMPSECGESKGPNGEKKVQCCHSLEQKLASWSLEVVLKAILFCNLLGCRWLVASPGAATSAKEAIPRRTGLDVKTEASAQAIDCLSDKSDKQRWIVAKWSCCHCYVETDTDHFVFDPKFRQAATAHCCPLSLYPWLSQTLDNIRPDSLLPIIAAVLCCVSICRHRKPWIDSIDRVPEVVERGRINLFPLKEEKAPVKPCPARASPHFV